MVNKKLNFFKKNSFNFLKNVFILDQYGVCIFSILNEEECEKTKQAMQNEINSWCDPMKQLKPIDFNDSSTWEKQNWPAKRFVFLFSNHIKLIMLNI